MNLEIDNGTLYVNQHIFCFVEVGNGRNDFPNGRFAVSARNAPEGKGGGELLHADALGWLGADVGCDVVLGSVRVRNGVIPSPDIVGSLLKLIREAASRGETATLVIDQ